MISPVGHFGRDLRPLGGVADLVAARTRSRSRKRVGARKVPRGAGRLALVGKRDDLVRGARRGLREAGEAEHVEQADELGAGGLQLARSPGARRSTARLIAWMTSNSAANARGVWKSSSSASKKSARAATTCRPGRG